MKPEIMFLQLQVIPRYKDNDRVTIEFHEIEKPDFEELMNKLK